MYISIHVHIYIYIYMHKPLLAKPSRRSSKPPRKRLEWKSFAKCEVHICLASECTVNGKVDRAGTHVAGHLADRADWAL